MFSCFSKKNKIQRGKKLAQNRFVQIQSANDSNSSIITPQSNEQTSKMLKQSKIYQQQLPTQDYTAKQSHDQIQIDSILKMQIYNNSSLSQNSDKVIYTETPSKTPQIPNTKILNKYTTIHDADELFVVRETNSESVPYRDQESCNLSIDDDMHWEHNTPRQIEQPTHTLHQIQFPKIKETISYTIATTTTKKPKHHPRRSKTSELPKMQYIEEYDPESEQQAINTTISLPNFHKQIQKIQSKIQEQLDDLYLNQTYQEAENSFYCQGVSISEQFTRAVISNSVIDLAQTIYSKMTAADKNKCDFKGYTPVQLLVLKALQNQKFIQLAKHAIYDPQISLECKGPSGWNPLQDALYYRSIPLVTHIFKSAYSKKQQSYNQALSKISQFLLTFPDFSLQIDVKVDSYIPLLGNFTPNDTLKIKKINNQVKLDYSLVGYEFLSCKRRQMSVLFNGKSIFGLNNSKQIYCDLLEPLDHQQMILMVQDMLSSQIKRGEQIVHDVNIVKPLSIFQNQITQEIGGNQATKYNLNLCYTSTSETRMPQTATTGQMLNYMSDYNKFIERRQEVVVKEKNKNKKVQLELWLGKGFGLQLTELISIFQLLGMGNNLIAEWGKFLKQTVASKIEQSGLFPLKIDIPLNYSLFFNMQFKNFTPLRKDNQAIALPESLKKVSRKEYQGTLESRQKRALYLQAYT